MENHHTTTASAAEVFQRHQRPCSSACQFLIFLATVAVVGSLLAVFALYLLRPHPPRFQITSVSVSPFSVSDGRITAAWNLRFALTNPNDKETVTCEGVTSAVYYRGVMLSSATLPTLRLPKGYRGSLEANITASYVGIGYEVARAIVTDWDGGVVPFDFGVRARIRYDTWTLTAKEQWMRVECENVKIAFNVTGNDEYSSVRTGLGICKIHL